MHGSPYDDYVMDHIRNARNYRVLENADHTATGSNPLCGDDMTLYLELRAGRIQDIGYQCTCCGISMAAASIMTEVVKGARTGEARALIQGFVALLTSGAEADAARLSPERYAMLETVRRFPSRTQCALLPWTTLERALAQGEDAAIAG